jgi:hypothetical protein
MPTPPELPEGIQKVIAQIQAHLEKFEAIGTEIEDRAGLSPEWKAVATEAQARVERIEKATAQAEEDLRRMLEEGRPDVD